MEQFSVAETIQRTLFEATGMSEQEASEVWAMMQESPFRRLIQYEIEKRVAIERLAFSTISKETFDKQQGIVNGLEIAIGILCRKDQKPKIR